MELSFADRHTQVQRYERHPERGSFRSVSVLEVRRRVEVIPSDGGARWDYLAIPTWDTWISLVWDIRYPSSGY